MPTPNDASFFRIFQRFSDDLQSAGFGAPKMVILDSMKDVNKAYREAPDRFYPFPEKERSLVIRPEWQLETTTIGAVHDGRRATDQGGPAAVIANRRGG